MIDQEVSQYHATKSMRPRKANGTSNLPRSHSYLSIHDSKVASSSPLSPSSLPSSPAFAPGSPSTAPSVQQATDAPTAPESSIASVTSVEVATVPSHEQSETTVNSAHDGGQDSGEDRVEGKGKEAKGEDNNPTNEEPRTLVSPVLQRSRARVGTFGSRDDFEPATEK